MIIWIGAIIGLIFIATFIFWVTEKPEFDDTMVSKITYKQFISMYAINKKAWDITRYNTLKYYYKTKTKKWLYYSSKPQEIDIDKIHIFYFGYFDWWKFLIFRKKELIQIPEEVLKAFQSDIDKYRENYVKDLEIKAQELEEFVKKNTIDEAWKEKTRNVILRIYNNIKESEKA